VCIVQPDESRRSSNYTLLMRLSITVAVFV
jgi:hypothetical protein